MTEPQLVYALQPDYGGGHPMSHRAFWDGPLRPGSPLISKLHRDRLESSFSSGNIFLAQALNAQERGVPITHLVMLHNDVVPDAGWIDVLMEEMRATDADMVSAVIPLKGPMGITSTAIDADDGDAWGFERRLTLREVYDLPETFSADDACPGRTLLVNTGCFILDFTKPWRRLEHPDGSLRLAFTCEDRVMRNAKGEWEGQHSPGDWRLSRDLAAMGARVFATRRVGCAHMGDIPWNNKEPWGSWDTDEMAPAREEQCTART